MPGLVPGIFISGVFERSGDRFANKTLTNLEARLRQKTGTIPA
jgi:hypothetical protein